MTTSLTNSGNDEIDVNLICEDTNLINDFMYDSIRIVELIIDIEEAFDIEFDSSELALDNIADFRKLVPLIQLHLDEQE